MDWFNWGIFDFYYLHCTQELYKYSFFRPVRVYWFKCHSTSPSLLSSVPARISNNRMLIRGPTSASSTAWYPVLTKTWWRTSIVSSMFLNLVAVLVLRRSRQMRLRNTYVTTLFPTLAVPSLGGNKCFNTCTILSPNFVLNPSKIKCG
jgi:hypothetical protein